MCGRYSEAKELAELAERFDLELEDGEDYQTTYNASPGSVLPVITNTDPKHLTFMKWWLLPHWSKTREFRYETFNAKAEELTWKPSFRSLLTTKRCLVPATGFYEWKDITPVEKDMFGQVITKPKRKKEREIYFINLKKEHIFSFAGLWDEWVDPQSGEVIRTFSVITTAANELVKPIHPDRMPIILPREAEKYWLDTGLSQAEVLNLLQPYEASLMQSQPLKAIDCFPV
ncbi:SOS response-associated peptidase (plasmid) [Adhaeribacter swui]|uniref:Abasic site processing protein n=1 Tax=Adhaeribacter swui TaxID=2086471 RepID=A0A7G7G2E9_9BACT|nr:SOS response-associated peptidase [Adhaeribacter swui]QNF31333.1 SOS response-associated peptidase [Adhaeribacter swui]